MGKIKDQFPELSPQAKLIGLCFCIDESKDKEDKAFAESFLLEHELELFFYHPALLENPRKNAAGEIVDIAVWRPIINFYIKNRINAKHWEFIDSLSWPI